MKQLELNYYYAQESEQFTFYRLPKILITDKRFKDLSDSAKLLYGVMLDRMSLSAKNRWYDEANRVYIKYSLSSIMEDMCCAREKAVRLLKELEDIGLIYRITRAGRASIIYVKNFVSPESRCKADSEDIQEVKKEVSKKENITRQTGSKTEPVRKSNQFENRTSGSSKIELVPVRKSNPNKTNINNTEFNNNHIYQSINNNSDTDNTNLANYSESADKNSDSIDRIDDSLNCMEIIKKNIDYDLLMNDRAWIDKDRFDELYQLICEVVCIPRKTISIAGEAYPYHLVKNRFLKLNASHLKYVLDCMDNNTTNIANIKSYLITALYNAPCTMLHYYNAKVNHNLCGN